MDTRLSCWPRPAQNKSSFDRECRALSGPRLSKPPGKDSTGWLAGRTAPRRWTPFPHTGACPASLCGHKPLSLRLSGQTHRHAIPCPTERAVTTPAPWQPGTASSPLKKLGTNQSLPPYRGMGAVEESRSFASVSSAGVWAWKHHGEDSCFGVTVTFPSLSGSLRLLPQ